MAAGVPLDMSRRHPEFLDPAPSDSCLSADLFLRQEPGDEEDEEDEDDGEEKEEDDDEDETDDGYSE